MRYSFLTFLLLLSISCKHSQNVAEEKEADSKTPVTVTNANIGEMAEVIGLNATSSFLMKTYVKATVNGYLQDVNIKPGDRVSRGQHLFTIRTKEAEYLGNTINQVDTSFNFRGLNVLKSPVNGYVTQLSYLPGNYVQDGEVLAAISEANSLVFILDLPYELKPFLPYNKTIQLLLPDDRKITGRITEPLPVVDPVSQTQSYIIRISEREPIPENLIAKVVFIKKIKQHAISLPKEAILSNEVQSEFWIMKMTDSTTAVKVPVAKGIETTDRVEILSPLLKQTDKIILTGNYGLEDTAKVTIETGQR